jgi:hypothetical protein
MRRTFPDLDVGYRHDSMDRPTFSTLAREDDDDVCRRCERLKISA